MKKRIAALLLSLVLMVNLLPASIWAEELTDTGKNAAEATEPAATPTDYASDTDLSSPDCDETSPAEMVLLDSIPMFFSSVPTSGTHLLYVGFMDGITNTSTGEEIGSHAIEGSDGSYWKAWCLEPYARAVNGESYDWASTLSNQTLKDVLQISYEWGYWTHANLQNKQKIGATQLCVWWSLGYDHYSSDSTVNSLADSLWAAAMVDSGCGGGMLYGYTCTTNSSHQELGVYVPYRNEPEPEEEYGDIRIKKTSADPDLTDGNSNYSLEGAVYGIYTTRTKANNDTGRLDTLTTKANGYSGRSIDLEVDNYYVKEITAPRGYKLDETVYKVSVEADETTTLEVEDEPEILTGSVQLKKTSANTALTNGNSCYSLQGAVYGIYSSRANANADKNRLGTLTTKADGTSNTVSDLEAGYSYFVKEITAPKGYALDGTVYTVSVTANKTATLSVKDTPQSDPVGVLLKKVDATTGKGETCS